MTVFCCPHCNNRIEVDDSFAGRDGWCRRCKNIITVPPRGQPAVDSVSPSENYERLAKAFQHAATKADRYQGLFLKTAEEKERLTVDLQELAGLKERFEALEQAVEETRHGGESPPDPGLAAAIDAVRSDVVVLAAQLEREKASHAPQTREAVTATDVREELQSLREQFTAHEEAAPEQEGLTVAAIERLRDDVEEQHRASMAAGERLDALSASIEISRTDLEGLRADRENLRAEMDALRAEREALRAELDTLRSSVEAPVASALEARTAALEKALSDLAESATKQSSGFEADVAALKDALRDLSESSGRLSDLDARTDRMDARIAAFSAEFESVRNSVDGLSASMENMRSETDASQRAIREAASDAAEARQLVEDERAARATLETAQKHVQGLADAMAEELRDLKAAVDALSAIEAVPPDEPIGEASFRGVLMEETANDGESVRPEVIGEDSEGAQQTMLNSFLRFMQSQSRSKQ